MLAILGPILFVYWLLLGVGWQNEVRTLVGEPDEGLEHRRRGGARRAPHLVVAVLAGRGVRKAFTWLLTRLVAVPPALALRRARRRGRDRAVGLRGRDGRAVPRLRRRHEHVYASTNASTAEGIVAPTAPERSGSPASLAAWDSLGMEGRNFVARGPSVAAADRLLRQVRPPSPIRVYVGLDTAPTARGARGARGAGARAHRRPSTAGCSSWPARRARAGSSRRPWTPSSTSGTATTRSSASSTPTCRAGSPRSSTSTRRARPGKALFDAVYATWRPSRTASDPCSCAYGLSLGSFSMQSPFPDAQDIAARTAGRGVRRIAELLRSRGARSRSTASPAARSGSPSTRAVALVRFAGVAADLAKPGGAVGRRRASPTCSTPTTRSCGGARR